MFNAKALKGHTHHTPTGFLVFNEGKVTKDIPDEYRGVLVRHGVIADETAGSAPAPRAKAPAKASGLRKPSARKAKAAAAKAPAKAAVAPPPPAAAPSDAPPAD